MSKLVENEKPPPYTPSRVTDSTQLVLPPYGYIPDPPQAGDQINYSPAPGFQPNYPPPTAPGYQPNYPPPPGYQPYVTQPTPGFQPTYGATTVTVRPQEIIIVGACPACRIGILEDDYTCLGIFCAIFFFPLGILACLALKNRRCSNCGAYFG